MLSDFEKDKLNIPIEKTGDGIIWDDVCIDGAMQCSIYCWRCGVSLHKHVSCRILGNCIRMSCETCESLNKRCWQLAEEGRKKVAYEKLPYDYGDYEFATDLFTFFRFMDRRFYPNKFIKYYSMKKFCRNAEIELPTYDSRAKKWSDE